MQYRPVPVRQPTPKPKSLKRILLLVGVGLLGLFIIVNLVLGLVYADKTYPGARVAGKPFGGVAYDAVPGRLDKLRLLPESLELKYKQKVVAATHSELGVAVDKAKLAEAVRERHWLPVWNLVSPEDTPLSLRVDDAVLGKRLAAIAVANKEAPVDARIEQKPDGFVLVKGVPGSALDEPGSRDAVLAAVRTGRDSVGLNVRSVDPSVTDASLAAPLKKLQTATATPITFSYGDKRFTASPAEVAGWYRPSAEAGSGGFALSEPTLRGYISAAAKQAGIRASNVTAAAAAAREGLSSGKTVNIALVAAPGAASRTLKYCTAVRGVDPAQLPGLQSRLLATFADERGWGLQGAVDFEYVASGCDFTVWLVAANQMPSFGDICDSLWSCMVPPNVVINFDRWQGASESWNKAGGYLEDYRNMVINHETGHWLGFYHSYCGGPGQQAPVMQQQSISLNGCTFNAWPTTAEMAQLKGRLGI